MGPLTRRGWEVRTCSLPCEDTARRWLSARHREPSRELDHVGNLIYETEKDNGHDNHHRTGLRGSQGGKEVQPQLACALVRGEIMQENLQCLLQNFRLYLCEARWHSKSLAPSYNLDVEIFRNKLNYICVCVCTKITKLVTSALGMWLKVYNTHGRWIRQKGAAGSFYFKTKTEKLFTESVNLFMKLLSTRLFTYTI